MKAIRSLLFPAVVTGPFSATTDEDDGRRECVSCGRWSGGGAARREFDASTVFFHAAKIMLMNGT